MKGKKCIGLVIFFITFLLSLNLSLNASAITFTENLHKIGTIQAGGFKCYWKRSDNSTVNELTSPCTIPAINGNDAASVTRQILYIVSNNNVNVKKGHIYEVKVYTRITQSANALGYITYPIPVIWSVAGSGTPLNLILRQVDIDYEGVGTVSNVSVLNNTTYTYEYYPQQIIVYSLYMEAQNDGTGQFKIGRDNNTQFFNLPPGNLYVPPFQLSFNVTINEYSSETSSDEVAEKELEDRDNLEEQSETTDGQADTASNAAEQTGTTLFGAFTQLLTALTNVSGNSCTLPSMQVYSLNLGRMDLCTFTVPSQITALVSIGMVFIIVPLGIHLVKRMINLYKEITG